MTDFAGLIHRLADASVEFILVGGVAATAHGSSRLTEDVDVVYRHTPENIARVVAALAPLTPYPRGAPPGLPFIWDDRTVRMGLNFTLRTPSGPIDLLGEITGGGNYDALLPHSVAISLYGRELRCLSLEKLIHVKRCAGRPKDFEAIAELQIILDEQRRRHG